MAKKKLPKTEKQKDYLRYYGCDDKMRYKSHAAAYRARDKVRYGKRLNVYRCEFCGWFHLGRSSEKNLSRT